MKKWKIKGNLIKVTAVLMCIFTLIFIMPTKTRAESDWDILKSGAKGLKDKAVENTYDELKGVVGDFVNLIMRIPDGVLYIVDTYVAGSRNPVRYKIEDKEYIYNFEVTPYEIFKSGIYDYNEENDEYITDMGMLDINFFSSKAVRSSKKGGTVISQELTPAIGKVYSNIRNLCIIVMMLVLMYIGIRIMISSIAEQQAKYKQLLLDWLVAFSLLFVMHYIMSFLVNINYTIIEMLCNDQGDSYYIADEDNDRVSVINSNSEDNDKVITRADSKAFEPGYNVTIDLSNEEVVNNNGKKIDGSTWGNDGEVPVKLVIYQNENSDQIKRIFKVNTLSYIRTVSYMSLRNKDDEKDEHKVYLIGDGKISNATDLDAMGYSILYVVIMIEIVMFIVIYLKRVIQLAFLTMIAPLVAFMYPLDKIGDGKAQAFNSWFKDYLFGVLIQPLHLLLYTVFIRAAGSLLSNNIIYALAIYAYMIPAEKYFKKILGFEKGASGVGMGGPLAGALGAGLAIGGLNKIAGIGPGPKGGGGKGKTDPRKHKTRKLSFGSSGAGGGAPSSAGVFSGAPSSSGGRFGARGAGRRGLTPSAGGRPKRTPPGLFSILGSTGKGLGRGISGVLTGGKYESMSGAGPKLAIAKNLAGKAFRGTAKVIGATSGGAVGLIAGTASAIVTGNESDILKGAIIGGSAGYKQLGGIAGTITGGLDNLSGTVVNDLAAKNDWVAEKVRVNDAIAQFAPELADLSSADRKKYTDVIEKTAAYTNFGSFDEVKAMSKALSASGGDAESAVNAFKSATSFGDLRTETNANAFKNNSDIIEQAQKMAGVTNAPVQRQASSYSDADVATEMAEARRIRARQKQKAEEELNAELDRKLNEARSTRRKREIADEHRRKIAELNASQQSDADLLAAVKQQKANADNAAAMEQYRAQLEPQIEKLYRRALSAQGELKKS